MNCGGVGGKKEVFAIDMNLHHILVSVHVAQFVEFNSYTSFYSL